MKKQPATQNTKHETENMEVHHHPQLHHQPKPWKEYILEYLMIVLAVTTGFFAESLRESIAGKEKERVYISGIIQNLKDDTARISRVMLTQKRLLARMDSALLIPPEQVHDIAKQDTFASHFFYFFGWIGLFRQNDNTLTQLRNAGGFSMIHRQPVADSIIRLSNYYSTVKINSDEYQDNFKAVEAFAPRLIKIPLLPANSSDPFYHTILAKTELFIQYDKPLVEQLYSLIRIERAQLQLYSNQVSFYKTKAIILMDFLEKEYHL